MDWKARSRIKRKVRKRVKEANKYIEQHGDAMSVARGIIELDPKKQKDAFEEYNGIIYVAE